MKPAFAALLIFAATPALAGTIDTNEIHLENSPPWLTDGRMAKVVSHIEDVMEWDIRKVNVYWYSDQGAFQKMHGYDSSVLAFSRRSDGSVHVGPRVTNDNFDWAFGHELTHIANYQKYKTSIPSWLDEGLANYVARHTEVDFTWLASRPFQDVHTFAHPFRAGGDPLYGYTASTALVEFIASKCSLTDLLQLSVGKNLESYLSTLCGIDDVNAGFKKWVLSKAKPVKVSPPSSTVPQRHPRAKAEADQKDPR